MPFYQQYQHGGQQISEMRVILAVRCKVFTAVLLKIILYCPVDWFEAYLRLYNPRSFIWQNTGLQY